MAECFGTPLPPAQTNISKEDYDEHLPRLSLTIASVGFGPANERYERVDDLANWHVKPKDNSKGVFLAPFSLGGPHCPYGL